MEKKKSWLSIAYIYYIFIHSIFPKFGNRINGPTSRWAKHKNQNIFFFGLLVLAMGIGHLPSVIYFYGIFIHNYFRFDNLLTCCFCFVLIEYAHVCVYILKIPRKNGYNAEMSTWLYRLCLLSILTAMRCTILPLYVICVIFDEK